MQALPRVMKAVVLTGNGDVERLAYRHDVPLPQTGPDDVLIRVGAAGLNNTDINTRIGWYSAGDADVSGWTGAPQNFPRIQGADAAGRIVAVGADVDPCRIGERVLVEPVFYPPGARKPDLALYFGSERDGAFAQYAAVPAAHAYKIISPLSDAELASFPCAASAAENMLSRAGVGVGETVLITGASGGVGSAAVQLAKRRGAGVVAVAGGSKTAWVASLGAARVIERDADLLAELGPDSVDVVVDVVGGAQFPTLIKLLRRTGRYAVAGAIAGPRVELDLRTLYLKDLKLLGCTVLDADVFGRLVGYIENGEITPMVAATYPLEAIVEAQTAFLTKRHTGKLVLIPPD